MGIVPDIQGFYHRKFPVSDLVRSVAFYETAMGARRIEKWDHAHEDGNLYPVILAVPGSGSHSELRLDPRQASRHASFDPVTVAVRDRAALAERILHLDAASVAHSPILVAIQAWRVVFEDSDRRRLRLYTQETHGPEFAPDEASAWIRVD